MANRSYPPFGKVKTIVIPGMEDDFTEELTLEKYKEKYGIDLKEYIYLYNGYIRLKPNVFHNALILVETPRGLRSVNNEDNSQWVKGSQAGALSISYKDLSDECYGGILLGIAQDVDFSIDNVIITPYVA